MTIQSRVKELVVECFDPDEISDGLQYPGFILTDSYRFWLRLPKAVALGIFDNIDATYSQIINRQTTRK